MSAASARGPLGLLVRSSGAQYASLGAGTLYFFPEKFNDFVLPFFQSLLSMDLSQYRLAANRALESSSERSIPSQIVIQTSGDSSGRKTVLTALVNWTVGATAVWLTFSVFSGYLPDNVKTMLPVTRNVFDRTSRALAENLTNVKDILGKRLVNLGYQQDELSRKQDETHEDVQQIQGEMGKARQELMSLLQGMDTCHEALDESKEIQSYTARGVKLLARCVASILPTNDHRIMSELERYQRDDSNIRIMQLEDEEESSENTNNNNTSETPARPALPPSYRTPAAKEDNDHQAVERLLNSGRISVQ